MGYLGAGGGGFDGRGRSCARTIKVMRAHPSPTLFKLARAVQVMIQTATQRCIAAIVVVVVVVDDAAGRRRRLQRRRLVMLHLLLLAQILLLAVVLLAVK